MPVFSPQFLNHVPNKETRRFGRLRCEGVLCNLGDVINISAGGVKITRRGLTRRAAGEHTVIELRAMQKHMLLEVECVRSDKAGLFRIIEAFRFIDIDDEQRDKLIQMLQPTLDRKSFARSNAA